MRTPVAEKVLRDIEDFLKRHDVAVTTFGRKICGDPALVRYLREGNGITSDRIDAVYAFMDSYKPESGKRRSKVQSAA